MAVSVKNRKPWPLVLELTLACECKRLPVARVNVRAPTKDEKGREAYTIVTKACAPSLTLGGKATVTDLPDAVADAPSIKDAVKRGDIVVAKSDSAKRAPKTVDEKGPDAPTK